MPQTKWALFIETQCRKLFLIVEHWYFVLFVTSVLQRSFNFVQNGADMNKTDFYSLTALQHATEFGHINVVEYLLQAGLVLSSPSEHCNVTLTHWRTILSKFIVISKSCKDVTNRPKHALGMWCQYNLKFIFKCQILPSRKKWIPNVFVNIQQ